MSTYIFICLLFFFFFSFFIIIIIKQAREIERVGGVAVWGRVLQRVIFTRQWKALGLANINDLVTHYIELNIILS
jgi:hypothetical protein